MNATQRSLVWDLPVRLFHWMLALCLLLAALCAFAADEHSPFFTYHALLGLVLTAMVLLRVVYGLLGSRYARFGAFRFRFSELAAYARGVLDGRGKRYVGHNPASSYAIMLMLGLVLGLAITGTMLGRGAEGVKEVHEVLAFSLSGVVALHILGVFLHTVRHRENITASMVHGYKDTVAGEGIASSRPALALVFVGLVALWTHQLVRNVDPAAQRLRLPVLGWTLSVGDEGGSDRDHHRDHRHERREEHDDD